MEDPSVLTARFAAAALIAATILGFAFVMPAPAEATANNWNRPDSGVSVRACLPLYIFA